jgi:hypothetical protein
MTAVEFLRAASAAAPHTPFACQCDRPVGDRPCNRRMTQEDLLCDACRRGCVALGFAGIDLPHCEVVFTQTETPERP